MKIYGIPHLGNEAGGFKQKVVLIALTDGRIKKFKRKIEKK